MAITAYFVKKLGVMSVAQFGAVIGLIIGIINGIILTLTIGPSAAIPGGSVVLGVGSGIMMFALNVVSGIIFGFLGGAAIAFIYNFSLNEMGGMVEFEVRQ
jgi:uncharacterized protein YqgC (DUF456 family)